eukprot:4371444-Heterocapsa_arctica.AAC.1
MAESSDRSCPYCDDLYLMQGLDRRHEVSHTPCLARIMSRWRSIVQLQILIRQLVRSNRADYHSWQTEQLH